MEQNIDAMFLRLQRTEEKHKACDEYIKFLKNKIASTDQKIAETRAKTAVVQIALNDGMMELCKLKVRENSLRIRENIFRERNLELDEEKENLDKTLADLSRRYLEQTERFHESVVLLRKQYGMDSLSQIKALAVAAEENKENIPIEVSSALQQELDDLKYLSDNDFILSDWFSGEQMK